MSTSVGGANRNAGSMQTRTISRTRLRSLFRSTIMCPYFGTMIPTRADDDGEAVIRTSSSPDLTRFPVRLTSSISGARDNRCARENLRCDVGCALELESGTRLSPASSTGACAAACTVTRATTCAVICSSYAPRPLTDRSPRCQRTSTATAPSGFCGPSCGGVLVPHAPSAWTFARETRAS